jgi:hypothetical protein
MSELETFVDDCFVAVLGRPSDKDGLDNYVQLIEDGKLKKDNLPSALRASEEYKSRITLIRNNKEIGDYVKKQFLEVIHRPVDTGGLVHYTKQILEGNIAKEELEGILKSSDEYSNKFGGGRSKIVFCQCTHGEQENWTKRCINTVKKYVDHMLVIYDDTVSEGFKEWLKHENVEGVYAPFTDDFSANRNNYITRVDNGEWLLVSDPDEIFSNDALSNVRRLVNESDDGKKYNLVRFKGDLVILDDDGTETHTVSEWYKFMLFQKSDLVHYTGLLHETLVGDWNEIEVPYLYYHYKTIKDDIERSARNFFVCGGGENDESDYWKQWREWLVKEFNIKTWRELKQTLEKGGIPQPLEDWIVSIKDKADYNPRVDREVQAFYKYYFSVLYPDEET